MPCGIEHKQIVTYSIQLVLVRGRDIDKTTEGPQNGVKDDMSSPSELVCKASAVCFI